MTSVSQWLNFVAVLCCHVKLTEIIFDQNAVGLKLLLGSLVFSTFLHLVVFGEKTSRRGEFGIHGRLLIIQFPARFKKVVNLFSHTILFFLELSLGHWTGSIRPSNDVAQWNTDDSSSKEKHEDKLAPESPSTDAVGLESYLGVQGYLILDIKTLVNLLREPILIIFFFKEFLILHSQENLIKVVVWVFQNLFSCRGV